MVMTLSWYEFISLIVSVIVAAGLFVWLMHDLHEHDESVRQNRVDHDE